MVAVLEMGKFMWMLNAIVPGVDRRPLKKAQFANRVDNC